MWEAHREPMKCYIGIPHRYTSVPLTYAGGAPLPGAGMAVVQSNTGTSLCHSRERSEPRGKAGISWLPKPRNTMQTEQEVTPAKTIGAHTTEKAKWPPAWHISDHRPQSSTAHQLQLQPITPLPSGVPPALPLTQSQHPEYYINPSNTTTHFSGRMHSTGLSLCLRGL